MKEYIEREAVVDTIYAAFKKYWAIPCSSVDLAVQRDVVHTKNKIYNIPAADAVPVVRCKDCWNTTEVDGHMGTVLYCHVCDRDVDGEHFCSYGERKRGDGNG